MDRKLLASEDDKTDQINIKTTEKNQKSDNNKEQKRNNADKQFLVYMFYISNSHQDCFLSIGCC